MVRRARTRMMGAQTDACDGRGRGRGRTSIHESHSRTVAPGHAETEIVRSAEKSALMVDAMLTSPS